MNENTIRRATALATTAVLLASMTVAASGASVEASNGEDVFASVAFGDTADGGNGKDEVRGPVLGTFDGGNGDDIVGTNAMAQPWWPLVPSAGFACPGWSNYSVRGTFNGGRGNDTVVCDVNDEWRPAMFNGGRGDDSVLTNVAWGAIFNGGPGDDDIKGRLIHATFNGGKGDDRVAILQPGGVFDGGPGVDTVVDYQGGTCLNVEIGCP